MRELKYVVFENDEKNLKTVTREEAKILFSQLTNIDEIEFKDLENDVLEMHESSLFSGCMDNSDIRYHILISPN